MGLHTDVLAIVRLGARAAVALGILAAIGLLHDGRRGRRWRAGRSSDGLAGGLGDGRGESLHFVKPSDIISTSTPPEKDQ